MTAIAPSAPILLHALVEAFDWTSDLTRVDPLAFVSRVTGQIHLASGEDAADALPTDVYDEARYAMVPSRRDFDLGKRLAVRFVQRHAPAQLEQTYDCYAQPGAAARFRTLMDAAGVADAWDAFERAAVESALRDWADAHALLIAD